MHGQFIWYELTTPDVAAAKKFYPRFTGWGTQPFDKDYTMWTTGGSPFAGLFALNDQMRQQGVPPNWMPYIESKNVDETVKKATSLGGKVMAPPADIPNVGRYAVVADPQGAVFGVYKSAMGLAAWDGTAVVGRFSWHELMTTDYVKANEFYSALFDWEKTGEMDMGGGSMYYMYGKGDKMYGGMFNQTPDMAGMHPFWLLYIHVKDVGQAVAAAVKAGAQVIRPQMDIPGGSIAILGDPQGAGFALHHANPVVAEPSTAQKVVNAAKSVATSAKKAVKAAKKAVTSVAKKVAKKVGKKAAPKATKAPAKTVAKAAAKRPVKAVAKKPVKAAAKKPVKAAAKAKGKAVKRAKAIAKPVAKKKAKAVARKAPAPKPKAKVKAKARRR